MPSSVLRDALSAYVPCRILGAISDLGESKGTYNRYLIALTETIDQRTECICTFITQKELSIPGGFLHLYPYTLPLVTATLVLPLELKNNMRQ